MEVLLSYFLQYWGLIIVVIGFIVFLISQGKARAGQIILSLMLRAEKDAEAYAIKTGDEKFQFVVEKGYALLPKYVQMFISYKMFEELAKLLYAKAKEYLLSLEEKPLEANEPEDKAKEPG